MNKPFRLGLPSVSGVLKGWTGCPILLWPTCAAITMVLLGGSGRGGSVAAGCC